MTAFKAYDIRGIYPSEINESFYFKLGVSITKFLNAKTLLVGFDARPSSKSLFKALVNGANENGVKVSTIGMTGTEVMYFTVGDMGFDAGVMITASHNPKEYNGLKVVGKGAFPVGEANGLKEIEKLVMDMEEPSAELLNKTPLYDEYDPYPRFREKINSIVNLSELPNLKVAVDAGNGTGGLVFNKIFKDTALDVTELYFEPDGTFPNHEANPTKPENLMDIKNVVKSENYDLGIALDGDGDRVVFIDDTGEDSVGYYIFTLLIEHLLNKIPNAKIVHENRLYWAIDDVINRNGRATSIESKAGHSFIKAKMREFNAEMGGETSSHFFYKEMYYADSSVLTIALILEMMKKSGKSLRKMLSALKSKYFVSGEINFKVNSPDVILNRIKAHYTKLGFEMDELDGIAFDKDRDWHVSLRKSNTEPLIRLNVEAKNQELVTKMVKEIESFIE